MQNQIFCQQQILIYKFYFQALFIQFSNMESQHKGDCEYLDQYKIIRTLGSGYSAEVKLGVDQEGKYVAIKQYKHETSTLATLKDELKVMKDLTHENLIKLVSVKQNCVNKRPNQNGENCFAIVLEYAGGGELFDFVAETGKFSERVTRSYFHQMMNGLHYMHDKGYAHRDIKPENLLLTMTFVLKIADFGFSCLIRGHDGTGVLKTKLGTEGYMAPEIALKNYDGRKTDIFAAGVILFIMYAGNPPFEKATITDPYYKLIKEKRFDVFWNAHSRKRLPTFFTDSFKDLVQKMISYVPSQRPTVIQISKHPWSKGGVCIHQEIFDEFKERKKKMELVLEKKRLQKQREQHRRNQNIQNQGYNSRGNESLQDKQFIDIYNKQKVRLHKLNRLEVQSIDDITVKEEYVSVVSQLKYFLATHRISLEQADEQSEEFINEQVQELKCESLLDLEDRIQLRYKYNIQIQNQLLESQIAFSIYVGQSSDKQIQIHFQLESGCSFYFKKIIKDIKINCFP